MDDTAEGTSGATSKFSENTELLQHVQYLENCPQLAESVAEERAAELELARRELRSISESAKLQREENERELRSVC